MHKCNILYYYQLKMTLDTKNLKQQYEEVVQALREKITKVSTSADEDLYKTLHDLDLEILPKKDLIDVMQLLASREMINLLWEDKEEKLKIVFWENFDIKNFKLPEQPGALEYFYKLMDSSTKTVSRDEKWMNYLFAMFDPALSNLSKQDLLNFLTILFNHWLDKYKKNSKGNIKLDYKSWNIYSSGGEEEEEE